VLLVEAVYRIALLVQQLLGPLVELVELQTALVLTELLELQTLAMVVVVV
jgi:hypothetical protein